MDRVIRLYSYSSVGIEADDLRQEIETRRKKKWDQQDKKRRESRRRMSKREWITEKGSE